jgi:hypothetical protein
VKNTGRPAGRVTSVRWMPGTGGLHHLIRVRVYAAWTDGRAMPVTERAKAATDEQVKSGHRGGRAELGEERITSLSEEFGQQQGFIAVAAGPAEAERAAEELAVWAAALADEALLAARALVDGVRPKHRCRRGEQSRQPAGRPGLAAAVRALLARRRAVGGSRGRQGRGAAGAPTGLFSRGTVTRTVTHGILPVAKGIRLGRIPRLGRSRGVNRQAPPSGVGWGPTALRNRGVGSRGAWA